MADQANSSTDAAQQAPKLQVNAQYIKDLSFENPGAPGTLRPREEGPKIDLDVNIDISRVADYSYEVALKINAGAKSADETFFLVELVYAGVFTLETEDREQLEPVLMMYCPNLLFPFARQIIATTTSQGGFPPLMLEPIDFSRLYANHKAQAEPQGNA